MAYKTFYKNFGKQNFFDNKILANFEYEKQYIRKIINSQIIVLDNNIKQINFFCKKFKPLIKKGASFYGMQFKFSHRLNKNLKINSFLNFSILKHKFVVAQFLDMLKYFNKKNKQKFLRIIKPVKGGYRVFSAGIIGFLPKSQAVIGLKFLLKKINTKKIKILLILSYFLLKKHILKKYRSFYIPFEKIKITLKLKKKRKKKAKLINAKRVFRKVFLNYVFLCEKKNILIKKNGIKSKKNPLFISTFQKKKKKINFQKTKKIMFLQKHYIIEQTLKKSQKKNNILTKFLIKSDFLINFNFLKLKNKNLKLLFVSLKIFDTEKNMLKYIYTKKTILKNFAFLIIKRNFLYIKKGLKMSSFFREIYFNLVLIIKFFKK